MGAAIDKSTLGWGDAVAPPGSLEYAKRWRLDMLSAVKAVDYAPDRLRGYLSISQKHPTWQLLTDESGAKFATFDDFCRAKEPWGLGSDPAVIRKALAWKLGETGAGLVTLPRDNRAANGANQHTGPREESFPEDTNPRGSTIQEKRLRAISRAPDVARDLCVAGLLGQKEAAKLGPKNPTPEDAARVTAIARDLATEAKALDTSTDALRKQAQRALNTKARDLLGVRVDRVAEALRAVEKMSADERERFLECVLRRWPHLAKDH